MMQKGYTGYGARVILFMLSIFVGGSGVVLAGFNCQLFSQSLGCDSGVGRWLFGESAPVVASLGSGLCVLGAIMFIASFVLPQRDSSPDT